MLSKMSFPMFIVFVSSIGMLQGIVIGIVLVSLDLQQHMQLASLILGAITGFTLNIVRQRQLERN